MSKFQASEEEIGRLKARVQVLEDREAVASKEVMVESDTLKKKKLQEQIDAQVARELE
nr:hypothetical protein [Tanacetum cinerariifolium]